MNTRFLAMSGVAAALALPAVAVADHGGLGRPDNVGSPTGATGQDGATGDTGPQGPGRPDNPGSQGKQHGQGHSQRCARVHTQGFQLHGTYASFDGTTLMLTNAKGNKQARSLITNGSVSRAIGSAKVNFSGLTDTNNDSSVGWDDVTTADQVVVHGRATVTKHGCPTNSPSTPPQIQRVKVVAPDSSSNSGDSAPQSGAPTTGAPTKSD